METAEYETIRVMTKGKKEEYMKLGEWNLLRMDRKKDVGAYLTDGTEDVLLPAKQVPADLETGDNLSVFVYRDSEDRLIATVHHPLIEAGQTARLKVKSVTEFGAFLDWGLERDVFLPLHEQTVRVQQEKSYLVRMYVDKSGRLAVTMRIADDLKDLPREQYQAGDHVRGTVVRVEPGFGTFVAIDNQYEGLIHQNEIHDSLSVGDEISCRIIRIRQDGKTDLSLREEIPKQMADDAAMVYAILQSYGGHVPYTDKTISPETVKKEYGLSKNAFKRALGRLLKEKKIQITKDGIQCLSEEH